MGVVEIVLFPALNMTLSDEIKKKIENRINEDLQKMEGNHKLLSAKAFRCFSLANNLIMQY